MISFTVMIWISFLLLIAAVVSLDLGVFHRERRVITLPEALGWTAVWITLALIFNVGVYYLYELNPSGWDMDTEQLSGFDASIQFFTGYVVQKSLSIDNVFVIAMVFAHFKVPLADQRRVLFWGILGAVMRRGLMSLVFLLAYIGLKMLLIHYYPIPNVVSLAVIGGILAVGILASTKVVGNAATLMSPLAHDLERLFISSYQKARRAVILLVGSLVLIIGIAMIVLPGPAILVIPLGLAILGIEFAWARRWLTEVKIRLQKARELAKNKLRRK